MKKYSTNSINFIFPDNWEIDKDENVITTYDGENGLGALQFSIFKMKNNKEKFNLTEILQDLLNGFEIKNIKIKNDIAFTKALKDSRIWYFWLIPIKNNLILASYNCEIEDEGKEYNLIEKIINSITSI